MEAGTLNINTKWSRVVNFMLLGGHQNRSGGDAAETTPYSYRESKPGSPPLVITILTDFLFRHKLQTLSLPTRCMRTPQNSRMKNSERRLLTTHRDFLAFGWNFILNIFNLHSSSRRAVTFLFLFFFSGVRAAVI
jgi:hypothetical protein